MATYSTLGKICHIDADVSGSGSWRHMATLGVVCAVALQAGQYRGLVTGTCSVVMAADGKQQHKRPAIVAMTADGTTARHMATIGETPAASFSATGLADHNRPSIARYELYHAIGDSPFDWEHPIESYTSLPHTTTATFLTPGKNRFCIRELNAYGYSSENWTEHVVWVDSGGDQLSVPYSWLSPPQFVTIRQVGTDSFTVDAIYDTAWDSECYAKAWGVYVTLDGSEPSPDTPDSAVAYSYISDFLPVMPPDGILPGRYHPGTGTPINYPTGLANGTVVKARLRVLRVIDYPITIYSQLTTTVSLTIVDSGPPAPANLGIDYYQEATDG